MQRRLLKRLPTILMRGGCVIYQRLGEGAESGSAHPRQYLVESASHRRRFWVAVPIRSWVSCPCFTASAWSSPRYCRWRRASAWCITPIRTDTSGISHANVRAITHADRWHADFSWLHPRSGLAGRSRFHSARRVRAGKMSANGLRQNETGGPVGGSCRRIWHYGDGRRRFSHRPGRFKGGTLGAAVVGG